MPEPLAGESKKDYIPRCVSFMVKEEGKEQDQALAICFSMWKKANEKKDIENKLDTVLINDTTVTSDIEQNVTKGNVDVFGMKYRKKKRKNKLTGTTVVYEEN